MRLRPVVLLLAVLALSACGGGGGGGAKASGDPGGATLVPADVAGFVRITTDERSDQWKQADKLLQKFPGRDQLLAKIQSELAKQGLDFQRDLRPALGSELDLVAFGVTNASDTLVGMAKPDDPDKLVELLKKTDNPPKAIDKRGDGWVAFGNSQATVDRIGASGPKLADAPSYKDALEKLPNEALATVWLNGNSILKAAASRSNSFLPPSGKLDWLAAALDAKDNGVELKVAVKGASAKVEGAYKSALLDKVPSGTLVFATVRGIGGAVASFEKSAGNTSPMLESALGVSLKDLAALFSGETGLYVRPGTPVPEVTLVLDGTNATAKLASLGRLAQKLTGLFGAPAVPTPTTVDGTPMTELDFGPISVLYGAADGRVILTDTRNAIRDLRGGGQSLADDPVFKSAKEAAGMPDETSGFLYVDLKDLIPTISGLAGSALSPDVEANLRPLHSLLAYATADGDTTVGTLFLEIE